MNENTKAVDVLAVMDMALLYVEEAHEIHPGDFKPGVGKRNTGKVIEARAAVAELIAAANAVHSKVIVSHESWDAVERLGDALSRIAGVK